MITIYHLGVSQSDRIVWLMEELGLPYQLEWFDRGEDGLAPADYLALHPASMAPVIRDGDKVLAESTAIIQYIAHKHGSGRLTVDPASDDFADYLYWLQFNNNILTSFFVLAAMKSSGTGQDGGIIGKVARRRLQGLYRQMDEHLANREFLAGDTFTLADLMSGFAVTTLPMMSPDNALDGYPNMQRYAQSLMERPAWKRAMEIAGPQATRPS
ncbi:glutathione S-transferase family protein [Novosphingobium pentaromativorans]|uniref:Putative glutathione S-transferase III n=1 Tax=Novosphingobium pentaromativorans US6-1 TaxID=1088721 RepID=G6E852_9SPHN|nr:glutathione S-transferase family protein [Novosphingobium pentaromativorans]AIT81442.1 glutathione S-transferase [Novosphingobium pentaromativorans US6-1]EHJ62392.1 putative glutathione S-transferase III [Novosphingobium pentaromativorans US6-1]